MLVQIRKFGTERTLFAPLRIRISDAPRQERDGCREQRAAAGDGSVPRRFLLRADLVHQPNSALDGGRIDRSEDVGGRSAVVILRENETQQGIGCQQMRVCAKTVGEDQVVDGRAFCELRIAMAHAGMDDQEVAGIEDIRPFPVQVLERAGRDEDEFRELVSVQGDGVVARRRLHDPHDAGKRAAVEIFGFRQGLEMPYLHNRCRKYKSS